MEENDFKARVLDSLEEIKTSIITINARCMMRATEIAEIRTRQEDMGNGLKAVRSLVVKIAASVIGGIVLATLGYVFGKRG